MICSKFYNHRQYKMYVYVLIIFFYISSLFSPLDGVCQQSYWTGQSKRQLMINTSGLSQFVKNINKATIYRVMDFKLGKYF